VIKLRHQQPSWWEGLFAEEVAELWEPWMRWWMSCWRMRNCWMWCMRRKGNGIPQSHAWAAPDAGGSCPAHADSEASTQLELRGSGAGGCRTSMRWYDWH